MSFSIYIKPMVYTSIKDPKIGRGKRIKEAIKNSGRTLVFIADKLDISANAIQKWQRDGNISGHMTLKLSALIDADPNYLYFGHQSEPSRKEKEKYLKLKKADIAKMLEHYSFDELEMIQSEVESKLNK